MNLSIKLFNCCRSNLFVAAGHKFLPASSTVWSIRRLHFSKQYGNSLLNPHIFPTRSEFRRNVSFSFKNGMPVVGDNNLAALQLKKRPIRVKKRPEEAMGYFNVIAYATAEEYDLERLHLSILRQDLYEPRKFVSTETDDQNDFLYVTAKYQVDAEPRDIVFFREGSVVFWNCTELECSNVLNHLRQFEEDHYPKSLVHQEIETMSYNYNERAILTNGKFYLSQSDATALEKYTFSNAMSISVKLGIWEASLDKYVDSMGHLTEDLKRGRKIKTTRSEMLRKTGELFALRHLINLSSDLLDTPDFYWDREQLESLYLTTCAYFSVQRRTKVMNEKLNHCVELADLISSNLNDAHHVRLEWMIIVLIMIEVVFECLHLADKFIPQEVADNNEAAGAVAVMQQHQ